MSATNLEINDICGILLHLLNLCRILKVDLFHNLLVLPKHFPLELQLFIVLLILFAISIGNSGHCLCMILESIFKAISKQFPLTLI